MKKAASIQPALTGTVETPLFSQQLSDKEILLLGSASIFSKDFTAEELKVWKKMMENLSLPDLQYAFEKWNMEEKFFPKPADIRESIAAKRAYESNAYDSKKYSGKGYGKDHVLALWDKILKKPSHKLSKNEVEGTLAEIDKKLNITR